MCRRSASTRVRRTSIFAIVDRANTLRSTTRAHARRSRTVAALGPRKPRSGRSASRKRNSQPWTRLLQCRQVGHLAAVLVVAVVVIVAVVVAAAAVVVVVVVQLILTLLQTLQ